MNKRLVKKKMKKNESFEGVIFADGNKGGDMLHVIDNCDGTVRLRSSHCCVTDINRIVPVEFITAILSQVMLDHNHNIDEVIDSFKWSKQFKAQLKSKVR